MSEEGGVRRGVGVNDVPCAGAAAVLGWYGGGGGRVEVEVVSRVVAHLSHALHCLLQLVHLAVRGMGEWR